MGLVLLWLLLGYALDVLYVLNFWVVNLDITANSSLVLCTTERGGGASGYF